MGSGGAGGTWVAGWDVGSGGNVGRVRGGGGGDVDVRAEYVTGMGENV